MCKDLAIGRMVSPMECLLCVNDLVIGRMVSPMECLLCVKI